MKKTTIDVVTKVGKGAGILSLAGTIIATSVNLFNQVVKEDPEVEDSSKKGGKKNGKN